MPSRAREASFASTSRSLSYPKACRSCSQRAPSTFRAFLLAQAQMQLYSRLSKGKSAAFYGITSLYRQDKRPFFEDVQALFGLLEQGKLRPAITQKLPILEAAKANELLETGKVSGQIVLLAPELL